MRRLCLERLIVDCNPRMSSASLVPVSLLLNSIVTCTPPENDTGQPGILPLSPSPAVPRLGHATRHFNVGSYRRRQKDATEVQDASFFDHRNEVSCAVPHKLHDASCKL